MGEGREGGREERGKDKRERDLDVLGAVSFSLFPLYLQSQWSNLPSISPICFSKISALLSNQNSVLGQFHSPSFNSLLALSLFCLPEELIRSFLKNPERAL